MIGSRPVRRSYSCLLVVVLNARNEEPNDRVLRRVLLRLVVPVPGLRNGTNLCHDLLTDQVIPLEIQRLSILIIGDFGTECLEHGLQSRKGLLRVRHVVIDPATVELLQLTFSVNNLPLKGSLVCSLVLSRLNGAVLGIDQFKNVVTGWCGLECLLVGHPGELDFWHCFLLLEFQVSSGLRLVVLRGLDQRSR